MDPNSNYSKETYAPRGSNIGSNAGGRRAEMGERESLSSERQRYMQSVSEEQNKQPRFTGDRRIDNGGRRTESGEGKRSSAPNASPAPVNTSPGSNDRRSNSRRAQENSNRRESPSNSERNSTIITPAPANNGGGRSNPGSGTSPRGSNSGGNSRPR
jgi:hypothetical protein